MKAVQPVHVIYQDERQCIYEIENGLHVRDVVIEAGIGEPVYIGHLSDLHYNYCNQQDFQEANPVVMSTYENRQWLAHGESVPTGRKCLAFLEDADQLVVNGDTMDYLSHGCMELMQKEIWDRYPEVLASLGGHEITRRMQGKIEDPASLESRLDILKAFWKHDIYYVSKVIKEKVMLVVFFNDRATVNEEQLRRFRADLKLAREKGYIMLLFAHEPIRTCNPKEKCIEHKDVIQIGDPSGYPINFCDGLMLNNHKMMGNDACDPATKAMYQEITNNADVIKAFFAGHRHSHIYLEIQARNADGTSGMIPQFINTASAYQAGHAMRITVK